MTRLYQIACLLVCTLSVNAQVLPISLSPVGRQQFFNASGQPLAGGFVYFCVAGATCGPLGSTFQSTYGGRDSSGNPTSVNPNPVQLDSGGFATIFVQNLPYKMVVTDSFSAVQWTVDNIPAGSGGGSGFNPALPVFFKTQNNIRYSSQFPGSDCGAQINNAYADLPATGGKIIVDTSCTYVTGIFFGTNHKPATLEGFAGGAVTLTYTATSGTAITLDYGTDLTMGKGFRDLRFTGPGNSTSTIGVQVGVTNGAQGSEIEDFTIQSFGQNLAIGNNTWIVKFKQGMIRDGGFNFKYSNGTNTGENIQFDHVTFADAPSPHTNSVWIQGSGHEVHFTDCSFDQAQLVIGNSNITAAQVNCKGCHFENPNFASGVDYAFILVSNGSGDLLRVSDSYFIQDRTTGGAYPAFITANNGVTMISNLGLFSPVASTGLVSVSGSANVNLFGFDDLSGGITPATNLFVGSTIGCVTSFPGVNTQGNRIVAMMKCGDISVGSTTALDVNTGNIRTSNQLVSLTTTQPPMVVNSSLPVINFTASNHPIVYSQLGTLLGSVLIKEIAQTMGGGTQVVNFAAPNFSTSGSYGCALTDASGNSSVGYTRNSATQITIIGNSGDSITGFCIGI